MRKLFAAIIICILLFNWFGYRFVTNYMQHKADSQMETKLDNNRYDESQLIEIKLPIKAPSVAIRAWRLSVIPQLAR